MQMAHFEKVWRAVTAHDNTELDPPASDDVIAAFESRHGIRLPIAHRQFLMRGNGGLIGYARLFGVDRKDSLDMAQQLIEIRPILEEASGGPVLPFASDWGGSYFCYDLDGPSETGDYPVLFWNHECSEEPGGHPTLWSKFALDFLAFVQVVIEH